MKYILSYTISVFLSLSLLSCKAQDKVVKSITCDSDVSIQYEKADAKAKREDLLADRKLEAFTVYFLNNFQQEEIKGYVNDNLLFDEIVTTDDITGKSSKSFGYNYSKDSKIPVLKISSSKGKCFDIEINKKYKLIYIFLSEDDKWTVRYSNTYYVEN